MTWTWPIIIYLWLAGIGGGAYAVTFLAHHLSGGEYGGARRVAAGLGIPGVVLGVILLLLDLGHPFRAWHLFVRFRPLSPMSVGSWLLLLWAAVASLLFLTWWAESLSERGVRGGWHRAVGLFRLLSPAAGVLDWVELALSILLATYTGVLLSSSSVPLWSSTRLLPALFVASALATGTALLNLAGALGSRHVGPPLMARLTRGAAAVGLVEILLLGGLLLWAADAPPPPMAYVAGAAQSTVASPALPAVTALVSGALRLAFWLGVVGVGIVLPVGTEMALTIRGIERPSRPLLALCTLMVLSGGFVLRAVIVLGGQM
jgi:formate-dependent nitrite reductase membrane component NrfD